ncbi:TatD family hydrolase [Pseudochrobactrum sp. HB0163]|uniref:TatD family hydrolase n=1 Tax=Pseudochrobactrum sp. HB0163 TaxID=3450708 RepID=UPI003F6E1BD5
MLVDSHCHLDFDDFAQERDAIIQRALDADVEKMITICTRVKKFDRILAVAENYEQVYCSVGTHPNNAHEELDVTADELVRLAQHPKVVAIGESGLDYHYDYSTPQAQRQGLLTHIEAARRTQLPLVIHARSADTDMAALLREETAKGAFPFILHCFSSGIDLARTGIELGGYISFSGIITFKNSAEIREAAKIVPHDRLLVETDAPYLAPIPHRGKRNEPSFVAHTAAVLAEVMGVSDADIRRITGENVLRLFTKISG